MLVPFDQLVNTQTDIYRITCAMIKRAHQLTLAGDPELETTGGKVVPLAITQILSGKFVYRLEE